MKGKLEYMEYDQLCIENLPFHHEKPFICTSLFGYKPGDKVYICTNENIEKKYLELENTTSSNLKYNIIGDVYTYTKRHTIQEIKPVLEFDSNVQKIIKSVKVSFTDLPETFTITNKDQLFKTKTQKVKDFQDQVISYLSYLTEYFISLKKKETTSTTYNEGIRTSSLGSITITQIQHTI